MALRNIFRKQVWAGDAIVAWARWSVKHKDQWTYTQGPLRYASLNTPLALHKWADCSSAFTYWFRWAGVIKDPNNEGWTGGFTGTLLRGGKQISRSEVRPGDGVFYGVGTADHVALVVEVRGNDILTVSHGDDVGPRYVWVNTPEGPSLGLPVDGRKPQRFMRYNKMAYKIKMPPAS